MIEITGEHIKELNDEDLRSLVGLLCEAELQAAGLSTAGVTWGGHHNAKDGGVDVRVELSSILHVDNYLPREKVGFQVKKPDMPPAKILEEMRPNGEIRAAIKDLVMAGGAYIIVSSQGSTSDLALKNRKNAMKEALSDISCAGEMKLDFYDRGRIAAWVRSYPSLILWVRSKIGQPVEGWRPFENWSSHTVGVEEEYLLDEHLRIFNSSTSRSNGSTAVEGINEIRTLLHKSKSVIRLIGLSGVGKTRLLQALFDDRIGDCPLNKAIVYYCDIATRPNPDPVSFATQLVKMKMRAFLAVDNCPPSLHRSLAAICSSLDSSISLITVEYDVREDQPEETEVFRLEPASKKLIEKIIKIRFPHINELSARIIGDFSGGNTRIAIALSKTVIRGEDISHIKDEELFTRLFHQRNELNYDLLSVAEVCSLVYSFDCRTDSNSDAELQLLSSLIGISVRKFYHYINELKRRELVQQRGYWRAVLPHAIANKLAKRALENIPLVDILNLFENRASERLLRSFSRRLSFLHNSEIAKEICKRWINESGLLGDISNLNSLGISLLKNVAPIDPEAVLSAMERIACREDPKSFLTLENNNRLELAKLLRLIAFEGHLFIRSVELLCCFAIYEKANNRSSFREQIKSLFYIKLSGTHATPDQRLSVIESLINSKNHEKVDLGLSLLGASLQAWHFSTNIYHEFGAHSRDYGYLPRTTGEKDYWFKLFIDFTVRIAISDNEFSKNARDLLAEKFRELWTGAGMYDVLVSATTQIAENFEWNEGWVSIKSTIRNDGDDMTIEAKQRLENLAGLLAPTTLLEKARMYALSTGHPFDLIDALTINKNNLEKSFEVIHEITRALGRKVSSEKEVLAKLLPDILSKQGHRLFSFGRGLAEGGFDPIELWALFRDQLLKIEDEKRNYQVVEGFLNHLSNINVQLCNELLDQAVVDPIWSAVFPILQSSVDLDNVGVNRLKQSLTLSNAPTRFYLYLAHARILDVNDIHLAELLKLISYKEQGFSVSVQILSIRLHNQTVDNLSEELRKIGQDLVCDSFTKNKNSTSDLDYHLSKIIELCFAEETGEEPARILCSNLVNTLTIRVDYLREYDSMLAALAAIQPMVFMDTFLNLDTFDNISWVFDHYDNKNPMDHIEDEVILKWCDKKPSERYEIVASLITPFRSNEEMKLLCWTWLAEQILLRAPDTSIILNSFKYSLKPRIYSGSIAEILTLRLPLLNQLKNHESLKVSQWADEEERELTKEIKSWRDWELSRKNEVNETFE